MQKHFVSENANIQTLINNVENVDLERDKNGNTALLKASEYGRHIQASKFQLIGLISQNDHNRMEEMKKKQRKNPK